MEFGRKKPYQQSDSSQGQKVMRPPSLYVVGKTESEQVRELQDLAKESGIGELVFGSDKVKTIELGESIIGWEISDGPLDYFTFKSIIRLKGMLDFFPHHGNHHFQKSIQILKFGYHRSLMAGFFQPIYPGSTGDDTDKASMVPALVPTLAYLPGEEIPSPFPWKLSMGPGLFRPSQALLIDEKKPDLIEELRTKALIIAIEEKCVVAETMIDEAQKFKQVRKYDIKPLLGVIDLKVGEMFQVKVITYPGERRFIYSKGDPKDKTLFQSDPKVEHYEVDVKNDPYFENLASRRNVKSDF